MIDQNEIVIPLSKRKIFLIDIMAAIFVALGIWILWNVSEIFVKVVGLTAIVFFGACLIYGVRKLFDKSAGLTINSEGIIDNASGIAAGKIPWSEVVDITIAHTHHQRFVTVHVRNAEPYISRGNVFQRIANRVSWKMTGSPINIASTSLEIGFEDLEAILRERFRKYKSA